MCDKIYELTKIWQEKVEMRNPYSFGEEDISFEEFAELFKDTFEIIRKAKNDYIYKRTLPKDVYLSLDYLKLLAVLSKYMTYDCTDDESDDKAFTVTCLIAQKLVEYATCGIGLRTTENGDMEYFDADKEPEGIFMFYRAMYPFYNEEDWEHEDEVYEYNIYEANFDEITELAKQLM